MMRWTKALLAIGMQSLLLVSARAQTPDMPKPPSQCAFAAQEANGVVTLPNLTHAFAQNRKIVALAIGSSVLGSGRGDYFGTVKTYLQTVFKGVEVQVIQRGVSGELARDAAARIKLEVARFEPDIIFWQVGTADAMVGMDAAEVASTVREAAVWLKEHDVDLVLIGLHYNARLRDNPAYQSIRNAIAEVARSEGLLRMRRYEAGEILEKMRAKSEEAMPGEDLTALGNACMAEYLARALATGLFGKNKP